MSPTAFLAKHFPFFSTEAKTLDQAKTNSTAAKAKVEAVAQLFENAGLDVDAILSAGPDSLKAHLATIGATDAQLAEAKTALTVTQANVSTLTETITKNTATITTQAAKITELESAKTTAVAVAVEMLAKAGHVVVKETPDKNAHVASTAVLKTRAEVNAMSPVEKQKFYREGGRLSEV